MKRSKDWAGSLPFVFACVAICAGSSPAFADPPTKSVEAATEITVQGERPEIAAPESSRHTYTRNAKQIQAEIPASLADALRRSPGVSVQQTTPAQSTIYVRGLSGREVAHWVDGVRLNSAIFRAGNNPYIGLIDVQSLERIDVVPGASSVLYGSDALAGAVLFRTRTPSFSLEEPQTEYRLLQSMSSNPLGSTSRVAVAHSEKNWAVHVGTTFTAMGTIQPGDDTLTPVPGSYWGLRRDTKDDAYTPLLANEQTGTEFMFFGGDLALRYRLGPGLSLTGRVQYGVVPELVRYDQITPRFKEERPTRAEARLAPMTRTMASLVLVHRPERAFYKEIEVQLSYQRLLERSYNRSFAEAPVCELVTGAAEAECRGPLQLDPRQAGTIEDNRSDAFGMLAEIEVPLEKDAHLLRLGGSAYTDVVSSESYQQGLPSQERSPVPARFPDGSTFTEVGVYALEESKFGSSFKAYAGVRGAFFYLDVASRPAVGEEATSPGQALQVLDWAASAGVTWSPIRTLEIDANVGRGVRAPNVQDLATLGPRAGGRYQLPNSDLHPERSYSADAGARFRFRGHRAETSLFYLLYLDGITLAPTTLDGASATPQGEDYYHSVNAASVRLWGVESYAELMLATPLVVFGRGLAILGTQRNPQDSGLPTRTPADRVPPHQGELGTRWSPIPNLEISAFVAFRKAQRRLNDPTNIEDNRIPEGGTPGFKSYHVHTRWAPRSKVSLLVNLDNITNERILEHGSGFFRPGFSAGASAQVQLD